MASLPLDESGEPVSWAGPEPAPVWLDAARDFTEYWVHQQQIREGVGRPLLLDPHVVGVVVDTFMRALGHTLRAQERPAGTRFTLVVDGPGGGQWTVERDAGGWGFVPPEPNADNIVTIDVDTAWRLCTRGIEPMRPGAEPPSRETKPSATPHSRSSRSSGPHNA